MIAAVEGFASSSRVRSLIPVQLPCATTLPGKSTQMMAALAVLLGIAAISVQFRFRWFATSPVTVNCQFASLPATALLAGDDGMYARLLMMINVAVMIVAIPVKVFFNWMHVIFV